MVVILETLPVASVEDESSATLMREHPFPFCHDLLVNSCGAKVTFAISIAVWKSQDEQSIVGPKSCHGHYEGLSIRLSRKHESWVPRYLLRNRSSRPSKKVARR